MKHLWDSSLESLRALPEHGLWGLMLSVSVILFFVFYFENIDGGCDKPGAP